MRTSALLRQVSSDWRSVDPTLDARPMLQVLTLTRLGAQVQARLNDYLHREGLNAAGWDLLLTLYRSAPDQGLTPGELTNLIAITPASITNRLDRLEHDNLIARTPDPHDARARRVRLTPEGRARVEALLPDHLGNEERMLAGLTDAEHADLERLLLKLAGHLEDLTP